MIVIALTRREFGANIDLVTGMHRLRRRVFKDRLDWAVSVSGDLEIDSYDALSPTYLLLVTDRRQVIGCVRLLPTTGPTMLANTFPQLLGSAEMPRLPNVHESSRFCVDTQAEGEVAAKGLKDGTFLLLAGMIEYGLAHDLEAIATVTDVRMERILRRAGWPLQRFAPPENIGSTKAVAGLLEVSKTALAAVQNVGGLPRSVLVWPEPHRFAA